MDAVVVSPSELKALENTLLSSDVVLHTRFRALFTLKALKSEDAVEIIAKGWIQTIYISTCRL